MTDRPVSANCRPRILIWLALWGVGSAVAQQASVDSGDQLQEITVTASKRAEPLQRVPEAVSAITGQSLQDMGATSFTDYARTIPSLTFTDSGAGRERPTLRGINASVGSDTVGYYIGETPIESIPYVGGAVNPNLIDLDHIEVLRGPQGTLYGGESIGGTIKLIPNAPNLSKVEGEVEGTGLVTQAAHGAAPGGYGDLVLNVPIVDGMAAVRGVVWGRDVDGFIDRTYGYTGDFTSGPHPIGTVNHVPVEHTWGFRGSSLVKFTDKFDVTAMIFVQDQHFNGFDDITGGVTNPNNRLQQNLISDFAESQRNQFALYSLTANYAFEHFNLVSNTSYSQNNEKINEEGTSLLQYFLPGSPAFPNGPNVQYANYGFTHETRIATSERIYGFDGVAGIFHFNSDGTWHFLYSPSDYNSLVAGDDPTNPRYAPGNNIFFGDSRTIERQTAEFGEITYHFTGSLSATVGLRHYLASNSKDSFSSGIFSAVPLGSAALSPSSASGWVHKGNLSYQMTDDHLIYGQYSEGFRPGFGNGPLPANCGETIPSQVTPDSVKNFEVGAKTAWFDKRLTANMALFRIDWKNIQQQALLQCGFPYAENFGDAVVKGAELEINDRLTRRVSIGLSGSYTQARLQQATPSLPGAPGALAGDQIEGVPGWQFAINTTVSYPILQNDDGYSRLDFQYTGSSWANYSRLDDGSRDPASELQVTRLLNLRTGMKYQSWDFSLSATNLLDTIARQSLDPNASVTAVIPGRPRYVVNRPRTLLVNAIYKF